MLPYLIIERDGNFISVRCIAHADEYQVLARDDIYILAVLTEGHDHIIRGMRHETALEYKLQRR